MSADAEARFRDDHLHLMACAAARRSVDVSAASSVGDLLGKVRHAVSSARGSWLRVWGYDDALLDERRHPTADELDSVTPGIPAVLHHITGHAAVINTAAGRALGLAGGELLIERHDVLAAVPRPDRAQTVAGVAGVLADLAAAGIVACTDATHTNDLAALELLAEAAEAAEAVAPVKVTAMVGADRLESLGGLRFGATVQCGAAAEFGRRDERRTKRRDKHRGAHRGVRIGHAKVMPPHDDDSAIAELVANARAHGFPVAIHAMDIDTLQSALDAIEAHPPTLAEPARQLPHPRPARCRVEAHPPTLAVPAPWAPDRIEHCALALPEQLDRIARLGITVATQPSFVTRRARKYREQLSAVEQAWLWPLAGLVQRGIRVTLSSDAPTAPPDPAEWIAAAAGRDLAPSQRLDPATARRLCLADGAGCTVSPSS